MVTLGRPGVRCAAAAVLALAAVGAAVPTVANAADTPADGIVVESDRDGGKDLYLINPDDGTSRWLTTDRKAKGQPAISPRGDVVAYVQDGDVLVVPLAGGIPVKVTNTTENEEQPAWSPDGARLVFARAYRSGRSVERDLVIRTLAGGAEERVSLAGSDESYPDWAGAGGGERPIVFNSNRSGIDQVWRIKATPDATKPSPYEPIQVTTHKNGSKYPAWSPDGKKLSFARWHSGGVGLALLTRDLGTGSEVRIGEGNQDWGSDWSPDGVWIAYRHSEGSGVNTRERLYRVKADGSGTPEPVPGATGNSGNPTWGTVAAAAPPPPSPPRCDLPEPLCVLRG